MLNADQGLAGASPQPVSTTFALGVTGICQSKTYEVTTERNIRINLHRCFVNVSHTKYSLNPIILEKKWMVEIFQFLYWLLV